MRQRGKIWRKYKLDASWRSFAAERVKYRSVLRQEKLEKTSEEVIECGGNIQNLYKLVSKLTHTEKKNLMPTDTDNQADKFEDYFLDKITKIWDDLAEMEVFKPTDSYTGKKLAEFKTL